MSRALAIVQQKLADGMTKEAIARAIDYSRASVSLYVSGKYIANVERIEAAILKIYDRRICPEDGQEKAPKQCQRIALAPRPRGFPDAESLWLTCQTCPHKPEKPEEEKK